MFHIFHFIVSSATYPHNTTGLYASWTEGGSLNLEFELYFISVITGKRTKIALTRKYGTVILVAALI